MLKEKLLIIAAGYDIPGFESYRTAMIESALGLGIYGVSVNPWRPLPLGEIELLPEEMDADVVIFTVGEEHFGRREDLESTIEASTALGRKVMIVTPLVASLGPTHPLRVFRSFCTRFVRKVTDVELYHSQALIETLMRMMRETSDHRPEVTFRRPPFSTLAAATT